MRPRIHKILVTGGAGFIGSEFVRQAVRLKKQLVVVDKITYAGDLSRLKEAWGKFKFRKVDICDRNKLETIFRKEKPQEIIHFAAETHVDRSLRDAHPFIRTNLTGTQNLIDLARKYKVGKFLYISTDEVYGESHSGRFLETAELKPTNPYSVTKTAAEGLVKAAIRSYQFPAIILRPSNNYGPWQYPEKFIPVIIVKALNNQKVPVYGRGEQIREWLYVGDCAAAILLVLKKGAIGETYNIGTYFENDNLTTAETVLRALGKSSDHIQFVKDRPGHDFRYSVNYAKLQKLGWQPKVNFSEGIKETVDWYKKNDPWVKKKILFLNNYPAASPAFGRDGQDSAPRAKARGAPLAKSLSMNQRTKDTFA